MEKSNIVASPGSASPADELEKIFHRADIFSYCHFPGLGFMNYKEYVKEGIIPVVNKILATGEDPMPVLHVFSRDKKISIIAIPDISQKEIVAMVIKELLRFQKAGILVTEAYMKMFEKGEDFIPGSLSEDPESTEGLCVTIFTDEKEIAGFIVKKDNRYDYDEIDWIETDENVGGTFQNLKEKFNYDEHPEFR